MKVFLRKFFREMSKSKLLTSLFALFISLSITSVLSVILYFLYMQPQKELDKSVDEANAQVLQAVETHPDILDNPYVCKSGKYKFTLRKGLEGEYVLFIDNTESLHSKFGVIGRDLDKVFENIKKKGGESRYYSVREGVWVYVLIDEDENDKSNEEKEK